MPGQGPSRPPLRGRLPLGGSPSRLLAGGRRARPRQDGIAAGRRSQRVLRRRRRRRQQRGHFGRGRGQGHRLLQPRRQQTSHLTNQPPVLRSHHRHANPPYGPGMSPQTRTVAELSNRNIIVRLMTRVTFRVVTRELYIEASKVFIFLS